MWRSRSCRRGDRARQVRRRADHARRAAALEGQATGTTPRLRDPKPARGGMGISVRDDDRQRLRQCARCATCTNTAPPPRNSPGSKWRLRHHAQHNPRAMLPEVVTVEDVLNSPVIADPLHRLDCCVISGRRRRRSFWCDRRSQEIEAATGENRRRRRDGKASHRRHVRSHHVRRRALGSGGRSPRRRDARRHQICVDLRQLHHHRC